MSAGVHLYQMTYWSEPNGTYHVNDVKNLCGRSAKWYTPMRILNLSIEEYIDLLINKFNAIKLFYYKPTDFLGFCFANKKDAHAFCAYVNKVAKKNNYYCC